MFCALRGFPSSLWGEKVPHEEQTAPHGELVPHKERFVSIGKVHVETMQVALNDQPIAFIEL